MAFHYWFQRISLSFRMLLKTLDLNWKPIFYKVRICFLLDELIYNVYSKFSHWKEVKKKKQQPDLFTIHYLFILICFPNNTTLRGFIAVDESSLLLMINVQTVHKYTIKERLSVCDCNCDFPTISDTIESCIQSRSEYSSWCGGLMQTK